MASPEFGAKPVTFKTKRHRREQAIRDDDADAGGRRRRPGQLEVRADGLVVYMRMPFLQMAAPQLKPWIKVDLGEAGKDLGIDLDALMELSNQIESDQGARLPPRRRPGERGRR